MERRGSRLCQTSGDLTIVEIEQLTIRLAIGQDTWRRKRRSPFWHRDIQRTLSSYTQLLASIVQLRPINNLVIRVGTDHHQCSVIQPCVGVFTSKIGITQERNLRNLLCDLITIRILHNLEFHETISWRLRHLIIIFSLHDALHRIILRNIQTFAGKLHHRLIGCQCTHTTHKRSILVLRHTTMFHRTNKEIEMIGGCGSWFRFLRSHWLLRLFGSHRRSHHRIIVWTGRKRNGHTRGHKGTHH